MASKIYPLGLEKIFDGTINLESDSIKVLLANSSHSFDANDEFVSDVSANEISGTGYSRQTLSNKTLQYVENAQGVVFDANDVLFPELVDTDDLSEVIVFKEDADDNSSPIISSINFDDITTDRSDIRLNFSNTEGIFFVSKDTG